MDFVLELPSREDSPATARAAVAALRSLLRQTIVDDVQLVVSELVTNSVKYGPGAPIRLELEVQPPARVRGKIVDEGDGVVEIRDVKHGRAEGLGLHVVDRVADRWGVAEGSTEVWFEIGD